MERALKVLEQAIAAHAAVVLIMYTQAPYADHEQTYEALVRIP